MVDVKSEVSGIVAAIEAAPGAAVEADQVILLIESMKSGQSDRLRVSTNWSMSIPFFSFDVCSKGLAMSSGELALSKQVISE